LAPEEIAEMQLLKLSLEALKDVDLVFSALPSDAAARWEPVLAKEGFRVVSNSSVMRLEPDVPLVNPEVNPNHLEPIRVQKRSRGWRGFLAKSPNCTTTILTLALKPLADEYGIRRVWMTTMQALSGAGLGGVYSMEILDNVLPYIRGEEEKVAHETRKIMGSLTAGRVQPLDVEVSATCTRVPVLEGHLESVFLELEEEPSSLSEVTRVL